MALGQGNKEVAAQLNVSEHTVKFHVSSVLAKLGARSRTEAVTIGILRGLVAIKNKFRVVFNFEQDNLLVDTLAGAGWNRTHRHNGFRPASNGRPRALIRPDLGGYLYVC